jgi:hypothetical protein
MKKIRYYFLALVAPALFSLPSQACERESGRNFISFVQNSPDFKTQSAATRDLGALAKVHSELFNWMPYIHLDKRQSIEVFQKRVIGGDASLNQFLVWMEAFFKPTDPAASEACIDDSDTIAYAVGRYLAYQFDGKTEHLKIAKETANKLAGKSLDKRAIFWSHYIRSLVAVYSPSVDSPTVIEHSTLTIWKEVVAELEYGMSLTGGKVVPTILGGQSCLRVPNPISVADSYPFITRALYSILVEKAVGERNIVLSDGLGLVIDWLSKRSMCSSLDANFDNNVSLIKLAMTDQQTDPYRFSKSVWDLQSQASIINLKKILAEKKGNGFREAAQNYGQYLKDFDTSKKMTRTEKGLGWLYVDRLRNESELMGAAIVTGNLDPSLPNQKRIHIAEQPGSDFVDVKRTFTAVSDEVRQFFTTRVATGYLPVNKMPTEFLDRDDEALLRHELFRTIAISHEYYDRYFSEAKAGNVSSNSTLFLRESALISFVDFFENSNSVSSTVSIPVDSYFVAARLVNQLADIRYLQSGYSESDKAYLEFIRLGLLSLKLNPFDFVFLNSFVTRLRNDGQMLIFQTSVVDIYRALALAWRDEMVKDASFRDLTNLVSALESSLILLPFAGSCLSTAPLEVKPALAENVKVARLKDVRPTPAPADDCALVRNLDASLRKNALQAQANFAERAAKEKIGTLLQATYWRK